MCTTSDVIFFTIDNNNIDALKHLLTSSDINSRNKDTYTPLMVASYEGKHQVVQLLVNSPTVDLNMRSKSNDTALSITIKKLGNIFSRKDVYYPIITVLIEAGADTNTYDNDGNTPLMIAAIADYRQIIKLILNNDADISKKQALKLAIYHGNIESVKIFLDAGILLDESDKKINTSFIVSKKIHGEIVEMITSEYSRQNNKMDEHSFDIISTISSYVDEICETISNEYSRPYLHAFKKW